MALFKRIEGWPRRRVLAAGVGIVLVAALLAGGWLYARSVRAARMAQTGIESGIEQAQPQRWEGVPGVTVRPLNPLPETGQKAPAPEGIPVTAGLMNCTYPSQYWAEHPEEWLTDNVVVGQISFSRAEMQSLLGNEAEPPGASLAKQFLTVILNVVRGAESRSIDAAIEQAGAWLSAHYHKSSLTGAEIEQALSLVAGLEAFNRGEAGPRTCAGVPRAYLISSATPTLEPTPTAAPRQQVVSQPVLAGSSASDRDSAGEDESVEAVEDPDQAPSTAAPPAPEPTIAPVVVRPPASPPGDNPGQEPGHGKDKNEDKDKGKGKDKEKDSKGPKVKEKDEKIDKGPGDSPGPSDVPGKGKPSDPDKDKGKDKDHPPKGPKKGKGN